MIDQNSGNSSAHNITQRIILQVKENYLSTEMARKFIKNEKGWNAYFILLFSVPGRISRYVPGH